MTEKDEFGAAGLMDLPAYIVTLPVQLSEQWFMVEVTKAGSGLVGRFKGHTEKEANTKAEAWIADQRAAFLKSMSARYARIAGRKRQAIRAYSGHKSEAESHGYTDELAKAQADIARLREALKPFAALADEIEMLIDLLPAGDPAKTPDAWAKACSWEDLIRARAALNATGEQR